MESKKIDKAIKMFKEIRDIPYRIPLTLEDASVDCDKKHKKLYEELAVEGWDVRYRICKFWWSDLNIPKKILEINHVDECEHLFLEIKIKDRWVILDVSWDIFLINTFPINVWDGKRGTALAVFPTEIFKVSNKTALQHNLSDESFLKDIKKSGKFYEALNNWMEDERKKGR